jgi:hypothetical protein
MEALLKGMTLKDWLYILTLIVGFGVMIFRQGRFFGQMTEHQTGQDKKIELNCKRIEKVDNEVKTLKDARPMTHADHFVLCGRNTVEMKDRMDRKHAEIERRLDEGQRTFQEITKAVRENGDKWALVEKQLAVNTTVLESVREQLQKMEART